MAGIPLPFIISDEGVLESIRATLGLWGILAVCIALFVIPVLFLSRVEDEFSVPLGGLKYIVSLMYAILAMAALFFVQSLILPVLFVGLILAAVIIWMGPRLKGKAGAGSRQAARGQKKFSDYIPPVKEGDVVINAKFRYVDDNRECKPPSKRN